MTLSYERLYAPPIGTPFKIKEEKRIYKCSICGLKKDILQPNLDRLIIMNYGEKWVEIIYNCPGKRVEQLDLNIKTVIYVAN